MPDTLTVYGQAPGIVDVLANDLDPAGGLLVVQRAAGDRAGQLDVAIIDGRWLRISAVQPDLTPSDPDRLLHDQQRHELGGPRRGRGHPARGPGRQHPDHGGRPGGRPRRDVRQRPGARQRRVAGGRPADARQRPRRQRDAGRARGRRADRRHRRRRQGLRVGPRGALRRARGRSRSATPTRSPTSRRTSTASAPTGACRVTVVPADDPNDPPEPPTLEGRVISADSVKIRVPGTGVDRNGDPVTVTGITSAPRLGRIVSFGGNFLRVPGLPAHRRHRRVHLLRRGLAGRVRHRHRPRGGRAGHAAPAAAGGRGPADRRARAYGDVRPARQRLRRSRRLRRGQAARRPRRREARPRHQPRHRAGPGGRRRAAGRDRLQRHQRAERVAGHDDARDRGGLQQPADRLRRLRSR